MGRCCSIGTLCPKYLEILDQHAFLRNSNSETRCSLFHLDPVYAFHLNLRTGSSVPIFLLFPKHHFPKYAGERTEEKCLVAKNWTPFRSWGEKWTPLKISVSVARGGRGGEWIIFGWIYDNFLTRNSLGICLRPLSGQRLMNSSRGQRTHSIRESVFHKCVRVLQ